VPAEIASVVVVGGGGGERGVEQLRAWGNQEWTGVYGHKKDHRKWTGGSLNHLPDWYITLPERLESIPPEN
jgi:hypothetical protein